MAKPGPPGKDKRTLRPARSTSLGPAAADATSPGPPRGLGATALPTLPQTVAGYLAHLADSGLKASTIGRRMAAIAYAHRLKGFDNPSASEAVHAVARGIRRRIGVAPAQKAPATARAIGAMLEHVPDTLIGRRDRAILLIGFAAALRRSEICSRGSSSMPMSTGSVFIEGAVSIDCQPCRDCYIPRQRQPGYHSALSAWRGCHANPATVPTDRAAEPLQHHAFEAHLTVVGVVGRTGRVGQRFRFSGLFAGPKLPHFPGSR
jgi:hypothetical protein